MNLPVMNQQPVEKVNLREDGALEVHSVFPTIQGEGPYTGTPAIFVRLTGCTLQCPGCDTEYTKKRELMSPEELVAKIQQINKEWNYRISLVVITGGEPFRQNISVFLRELPHMYRVQIETNGTVALPLSFPMHVHITCSPKTTQIKIDENRVNSWKYIIEAGKVDPADGLPLSSLGMNAKPYCPVSVLQNRRDTIFVQPFDEKDEIQNQAHRDETVMSAMKHGYRVSLQTHKILAVD